MARNKYPEETVRKILDVSRRLFLTKGYEHTTIQDIVDALGMSKGAVYHHFKSKEEILDRINDMYYDDVNWFKAIRFDPSMTGLEKARTILIEQLSDTRKHEIDLFSSHMKKDPKLIVMTLNATLENSAPFFQELVEEGIRDGSIKTAFPKELSEIFMLIINIWIGIFTKDEKDFIGKLNFLELFTDKMGLPLFNASLKQTALNYYHAVLEQDSTRA